jgi:hypothetical protein
MFGPTKRDIGTMLQAAPAFANHGVSLSCSVFARIIVALLAEAEAPELEHLWVIADDEPRAACKSWEGTPSLLAKLVDADITLFDSRDCFADPVVEMAGEEARWLQLAGGASALTSIT